MWLKIFGGRGHNNNCSCIIENMEITYSIWMYIHPTYVVIIFTQKKQEWKSPIIGKIYTLICNSLLPRSYHKNKDTYISISRLLSTLKEICLAKTFKGQCNRQQSKPSLYRHCFDLIIVLLYIVLTYVYSMVQRMWIILCWRLRL